MHTPVRPISYGYGRASQLQPLRLRKGVSMAVRSHQIGKCNHKISPPHPLKITKPSPPLICPHDTAGKPQGTRTLCSTSERSGIN
eukprot:8885378-Ditylum_brightwellii.AAC.1